MIESGCSKLGCFGGSAICVSNKNSNSSMQRSVSVHPHGQTVSVGHTLLLVTMEGGKAH